MLVYRLGSRRYPANDGQGANLYGGRWNHKGTPVIYAAASRALCALEVLANASELPVDYVVTPIELPNDLPIITLPIDGLPLKWNAAQPTSETADIGTAWARKLESVVLVVPSAVITQEQNYILNPHHDDFLRVRFLPPEPFHFDERLRRAWPKRERHFGHCPAPKPLRALLCYAVYGHHVDAIHAAGAHQETVHCHA